MMNNLLERQRVMEKRSFFDKVFTWSIKDILNKDLYKQQRKTIPDKFRSVDEYYQCFLPHLLEETRTELFSSFKSLARSPVFKIRSIETKSVKDSSGSSNNLLHDVTLMPSDNSVKYQPKCGDLIALTKERPRRIDDLNPLLLASVFKVDGDLMISVHSSRSIPYPADYRFGVFLMTLTTNTRIWNALHNEAANLTLIQSILQPNAEATEKCYCYRDDVTNISDYVSMNSLTELNSSQEEAIMDCLRIMSCNHKNSVKLIWGPPGTGKTKTVATLLYVLLKLKCKTVVCAPTNTAIVEVASRLLSSFKENSSSEHPTYRLADIVLSGNRDRMGITKDDHVLLDVFLDHRIGKLENLFSPFSGWTKRLESLIDFLDNTEAVYNDYVYQMVEMEKAEKRHVNILTFGAYVKNQFKLLSEEVEIDLVDLYTHLPKSFITSEDVKKIVAALQALERVRYFLQENASRYEFIKGSFKVDCFNRIVSHDCLEALRLLRKNVEIPDLLENEDRRKFCLQNAHIIFCTASGAADMNASRTGGIELVVIDEAAQLKECESVAALQLPGLRHAVLIGDEYQLTAMVHNEQSETAKFGRSLFERLVLVGHSKHLLNVQYRMHPSISRFPNKEFYGGLITDAPNVKEKTYQKRFLQGNMYGSFSFINVGLGKEEFADGGFSTRNMVEVAVISEIISDLFRVSSETKMKMNVGVVSPYKGQVRAIQERIEDKYSRLSNELFTLNVQSVDGFQGGEEDIIIIRPLEVTVMGKLGF